MQKSNRTEETPSRTRMTRADSFRVMRYLEARWDRMKLVSVGDAAQEAGKALQMELNPGILRSIVKDMGREYPWKMSRTVGGSRHDRVRFLSRQLYLLMLEVEKMQESLGGQFNAEGKLKPEALAAIVRGGEYYKEFLDAAEEGETEDDEEEA